MPHTNKLIDLPAVRVGLARELRRCKSVYHWADELGLYQNPDEHRAIYLAQVTIARHAAEEISAAIHEDSNATD